MDIWWKYIRVMFEEKYAKKENSFECTGTTTFGTCICIPCVAVNYIANEIKLCKNARNEEKNVPAKLKVEFKWEEKYGVYFAKREDSDWNKDIYDVKEQGRTQIDDAEICEINPTDFSYIKIRTQEKIQESFATLKNICFRVLEHLDREKAELDIYTVVAKNARNQSSMETYVDQLFRLLFFLHPKEGLEALDCNIQGEVSETLKKHKQKLLDEYAELVHGFEQMKATDDEANIYKILKLIKQFVGLDIWTAYLYLKESDEYGDIKSTNELFQDRMSYTLKLDTARKNCRMSKSGKKCLQAG